GTVVSTDYNETVVQLDSTDLRVSIKPEKLHMEPQVDDMVLIGGRPEYLAVSAEDNGKSIPGTVRIIQHLGSFIRYEVEVSCEISPVTFEIDMDSMQPGIHEGDNVFVTFDESRVALFSPEGREI
ncbi:MAG: TOBE domain-containing protein, partial [Spirochaetales bacterium]|nr:TOBE domain-containing protein [Spirochaetales bacterium]